MRIVQHLNQKTIEAYFSDIKIQNAQCIQINVVKCCTTIRKHGKTINFHDYITTASNSIQAISNLCFWQEAIFLHLEQKTGKSLPLYNICKVLHIIKNNKCVINTDIKLDLTEDLYHILVNSGKSMLRKTGRRRPCF